MVASRPEVEWDDVERGWMVALDLYRASLCPHCGQDLEFCQDPEFDTKWEVRPPRRCYWTTALARTKTAREKSDQVVEFPEALLFGVRPKTF